jgi:outer membrane protein OmpA-like peptidoglycan-associated protein
MISDIKNLMRCVRRQVFKRRAFGVLAFSAAFAVVLTAGAWAQTAAPATATPSVQTYVDQDVPQDQGILPEGMEWNRPLKAGELTLPKPASSAAPAGNPLVPPRQSKTLPLVDVQAPQIAPPSVSGSDLTSTGASSASVMLMQGMKNALQQSGQKLNPPQLGGTATAPEPPAADLAATEQAAPAQALASPAVPAPAGSNYQPGEEPKSLSFEASETPAPAAAAPNSAAAAAPQTLQAPASAEPSAPVQATASSEPAAAQPAPQAETPPAPAQTSASIFGPSVEQKPSDASAKEEASAKACEPTVSSWTRSCQDAGYPANYHGAITGETRVECPTGDTRDVWLSNSCSSGAAGASDKGPKATDLKQAPVSMAVAAKEPAQIPAAAEKDTLSASAVVAASAMSQPQPEALISNAPARTDASCGLANGLAATAKPAGDLCAAGDATEVSGEGPWRWSCKGQNGGMTVSCAASVDKTAAAKVAGAKASVGAVAPASVDGKCGSSDGVGIDSAPTDNLCAHGVAGLVNGNGPWTWACSGSNGGQAAACNAPKKTDGACGASADGSSSMPTRDLCAAGYASAVTGDGPWNWTCSGLNGGQAATCTAAPKVNAVCGVASTTGARTAPKDGLCNNGKASSVEGDGPWGWTCEGEHGGASVSCKAPVVVDGACGSAHGGQFDKAPEDDLCTSGKASRVTGLGPWDWNCAGIDGGNTASCTASLASKETIAAAAGVSCGTAAETVGIQPSEANLCAGGRPSAVTGNGPWSWGCSDEIGHNVACTTLAAVSGACGAAAEIASRAAPSASLCASGVPGAVTMTEDRAHWIWACNGSPNAAAASCTAPVSLPPQAAKAEEPKCGWVAGRGLAKAPDDGLCAAGTASKIRGDGPWTWSCSVQHAKKKLERVECEAEKIADGKCGKTNGSVLTNAPTTGLCSSGAPTSVEGAGPWLWSCVGTGGGSSESCSASSQAQTKVDGTCGAAAGAVMTSIPEANLCDSGVPSAVYGDGPWTWTCSGLNGGIAGTCSTSKVVPKAPPPPGPLVNGNCGSASGAAMIAEPTDGLCSAGVATSVSGSGPWNWGCLGQNGGMTVSCTAPLMPPPPVVGECGSAQGVTTLTMPRSGLCSAGIASAVSGKGPWTWSCSGTNGGSAVSCVAPFAGAGASSAPLPSVVNASSGEETEAPAPSAAPVGLVTPHLTTEKLAPMKAGTVPNLKPSSTLNLPKEPSAVPAPALVNEQGMEPPASAPELPAGVEPLTPPPIRDTLAPAPALKPPAIDANGNIVPGARLELPPEISTLSFTRGSDNLDKDAMKALDTLAGILLSHGNARITLTAYAAADGVTSPREARRLSLNRALATRDYLTNKGISSGRIDVRALGANVPSGDMDRVDVTVN